MGRIPVLSAVVAVVLALSFAAPAGAETKWVRGKVTAVSATSITVSVKDKPMTFTVDPSTDIVGAGLGTMTREAQAAGKAGITVMQAVKVGDRVEVHYDVASMKASDIRTGVAGGEAASAEDEGHSASGVVTAVTGNSMTIKSDGGEWVFSVDANTKVIGRGLGTMSRQAKEAGKTTTIADLVKVNDRVVVSYHEMAGAKHAGEVRVRTKAS
jgi:hypothetical protein